MSVVTGRAALACSSARQMLAARAHRYRRQMPSQWRFVSGHVDLVRGMCPPAECFCVLQSISRLGRHKNEMAIVQFRLSRY